MSEKTRTFNANIQRVQGLRKQPPPQETPQVTTSLPQPKEGAAGNNSSTVFSRDTILRLIDRLEER